jgi:hypothetical protein
MPQRSRSRSTGGIIVGANVFDPGDMGVRGAACGSCPRSAPIPDNRATMDTMVAVAERDVSAMTPHCSLLRVRDGVGGALAGSGRGAGGGVGAGAGVCGVGLGARPPLPFISRLLGFSLAFSPRPRM